MKPAYPTHSLEIRRLKTGSVTTQWGTFSSDAAAVASALSFKLRRGLALVRVANAAGVVIHSN